jgi:HKD family nuclease
MKVEAIPNNGPASMGPELDRGLAWATEADIATAFVTPAAVKRLETALSNAHSRRRSLKVRLLVGLYQRFTPPQALARLLSLRREFPGKLFVRVARNKRFHWKLYSFRNGSARRFYVGSANLTQDGMTAEGELCVKITAAARDAVSKSLESEFGALWSDDDKSVTLDGVLLNKYRRVARPSGAFTKPDEDNALGGVLKSPRRPAPEREHAEGVKPRVCFTPYDLQEETLEIVEAETNWDREGWGFTAYKYKAEFDRDLRSRVLVMVTTRQRPREYWLELIRVVDKAVLDTPDGKYFIAHARVSYSRACLYDEEIKGELRRVGLTWAKIKRHASLNVMQLETLCRILHVKPQRVLGKSL